MFDRIRRWINTCAEDDCDRRPTYLGWCDLHAPEVEPGQDEYWGDPEPGDCACRPKVVF